MSLFMTTLRNMCPLLPEIIFPLAFPTALTKQSVSSCSFLAPQQIVPHTLCHLFLSSPKVLGLNPFFTHILPVTPGANYHPNDSVHQINWNLHLGLFKSTNLA